MRILLLPLLLIPLCHAEEPSPPTTIDALCRQEVGALVEEKLLVGAAVGVISPHGENTFYYGRKHKEEEAAPGADTLFEIGSITKVFTGTLLAAMQLEGAVSMHDTVEQCLPEEVSVPRHEGQQITLGHLAMQNSGLPRLPDNFGSDSDPYAKYSESKLYEFLKTHKLRRAPGAEYEYSNLAVGLLCHALARRAGKSYEDLVQEKITRPLDMPDTVVHTQPEQQPRVAQGYGLALDLLGMRLHRAEAPWTWDVLAGAGALRSTLPDMMKFLAAAMGNTDGPLKAAFALAEEERFPFAEGNTTGFCWHITATPGGKMLWHNGGTGGYHAFLGFLQGKGIGVVILSNTSAAEVDAAAVNILQGASSVTAAS